MKKTFLIATLLAAFAISANAQAIVGGSNAVVAKAAPVATAKAPAKHVVKHVHHVKAKKAVAAKPAASK